MRVMASNVSVDRGGRRVLAGVDFSLAEGGFLELTGPNGSGKSTLLRAIAGLCHLEGALALEGGAADLAIGQQAHYIAHQDAVKAALTVRENLAFWAGFLGGGDVGAALASFALEGLADFAGGLLSQGQKRRLALSRLALVPRALWLLDEPSVGLDAASNARLQGLMRLHLSRGGLIIAATHVPLGLEPTGRLVLA
jgi:heme exporter protein A